jgi:hypothetical protein
MLEGPPVGKSFWMPILNAVVAGAFLWAVGWAIGLLMGSEEAETSGVLLGTLAGAVMWFFDHMYWLAIVHRFYNRPARELVEPEPIEDPLLTGRLRVTYQDGGTVMYIDPPVNDYQMWVLATSLNRGMPAHYENFTGVDPNGHPRAFTAVEFKAVRDWGVERKYFRRGANDQIQLTPEGEVLMAEIANGGLMVGVSSPT